uniref:Hydrophobin n=1 Tax=Trichoderma harzianum TaxID=5544 RepID=A0A2U9Q1P3_TRIHA|nr:hydrophobin [Trichoderma harzianum]QFR52897.1 hydrophobin [Trichoderma harzianum]
MKFLTVATLLFTAVLAAPSNYYPPPPPPTYTLPAGGNGNGNGNGHGNGNGNGNTNDAPVCPTGLYSNPQCCSTLVLGIVGLDCSTRNIATSVHDPSAFKNACAAKGAQAVCCVLPVAGQDVLCQTAIGA